MKLFFSLTLLLAAALLLSACGPVPINNYAGLSTDGSLLYVSEGSALFAVDPSNNGAIKWKYPASADQNVNFFAPVAVSNGWVYAATYKNAVFGFKLEGMDVTKPAPVWTFNQFYEKGRIVGAPLAVGDKVLVASSDDFLYALGAADGKMLWSYKTRNSLWAAPVSDGKAVFQAGLDHYLYSIDLTTGAKQWETDLGDPIMGAPALGSNGMLYAGTMDSEILAVDSATGKIAWRQKVTGSLWSSPLVNGDNLYFGTDQNYAYVLKAADGSQVNKVDMGGPVIATPVYTQDAVVFVTESGSTVSLSLDGTKKIWSQSVSKGKLYSNPIVIKSQIIVAPYQGDHNLAGFDFNGAANTIWNSVTLK